jgi:dolichyl-phosphate-mannose-protein mannosyltransferase
MQKKNVIFLTILIFLGSLPIYLYGLDKPAIRVWDEQTHILAAQSYFFHRKDLYRNPRNPPLGKELMAISVHILGESFFAYRLPSAVAAAGLTALIFFTGTWLMGSVGGGLLGSWLWVSSTMAYLHGRLATLDMMATFFFFAGLAAFLPALHPNSRHRGQWLGLACLLAALGGAVKVLAYLLFPLFLLGLWEIRGVWPLKRSLPQLLIWGLLSTLAVLITSYGLLGYAPQEIPTQIANIYHLQSQLHPSYSGLSPWYDWFIFRGNLWYGSELAETGHRFTASCQNNPVLWIAGTLACLWLLIKNFWKRDAVAGVIAWAIPLQILFWSIFKKQTILSYGLPMEPIFCLATAMGINELASHAKNPRWAQALWIFCLGTASTLYFWSAWQQVKGHYF